MTWRQRAADLEYRELIGQHKHGNFLVLQPPNGFGSIMFRGVYCRGYPVGSINHYIHQDFAAQAVGNKRQLLSTQGSDFFADAEGADFGTVVGY